MMKCLRAIVPLDNLVRPVVYLGGGVEDHDDWQQEVADKLKEKVTRGTILNPRVAELPAPGSKEAADWIRWNYGALDISDVVSFWFDGGRSMPMFSLFDLGRVVGRYQIGGGPKRVVVGCAEDCAGRIPVKARMDVLNEALSGPWKIPVHELDVDGFVNMLAKALTSF